MATPLPRARARLFNTAGFCLLSLGVGLPAMAQDAAGEPQAVEEVVISGSRVIRDGSQAPTPVTVLSVEQLTTASPRNIQDALSSLPAFNGSRSLSTPGMAASTNNVGGFLNLRGLGLNRTLVLVDGRRVAPQAGDGGVDFNLLPQSLISRVDVVTGGASAAYGSDAVAGVVNIILDTNFRGVKGVVQGGISDKGDLGSYRASITTGGTFLDDRLHLMASATINRNNALYNALNSRDWWSLGYGRQPNPTGGTGTASTAAWYYDVRQRNYNGGAIMAGANGGVTNGPASLQNVKFLPGGVVSAYDPGTSNTAATQVGGDGSQNAISLAGMLESKSYFTRATFKVTDTLELYLQGMSASGHARYEPSTNQFLQGQAFAIFEGNPFIPAAAATLLAASAPTTNAANTSQCGLAFQTSQEITAGAPIPTNIRCFRVVRIFQEQYATTRVTGDIQSDNFDLVAGFKADLFGYRLSGYAEHGEGRFRSFTYGNNVLERSYAAADVIRNPAVGGVAGVAAGAPVCRVSVEFPGRFPGCQPLNIFGFGAPSEESLDYILGRSFHRLKTRQDVYAIDLAGDLFKLPAGEIAFAIGAEHRFLGAQQISDPLSQQEKTGNFIRGYTAARSGEGMYYFTNQKPYGGDFTVNEGYIELDAPLLADLPLAQSLSLNGAYRYTDYSTSGPVETYKVGLTYQPVESIRFRGTYSRDIRAPSPIELFSQGSQGRANQQDLFRGVTNEVYTITTGNEDLVPEKADTYAFGVVLTPTWMPGFTASIDMYDINIEGAIGTLGAVRIIEECFKTRIGTTNTGSSPLCEFLVRDPTTQVLQRVVNPNLNLSERASSGVDLEISYRFDPGVIPGNIAVRGLVGYINESSTTVPGSTPTEDAGYLAELGPRVKAQASVTYANGPASVFLQAQYIGSGHYTNTFAEGGFNPKLGSNTSTLTDNSAPGIVTIDVTGRYKFGSDEQYEVFLTVNNALDKAPVIGTGSQNANSLVPPNNQLYDIAGRYYTTGLRFRF